MPDPKIDAEWIARCRKYCEAATLGPWGFWAGSVMKGNTPLLVQENVPHADECQYCDNAVFAVHARTDFPLALRAIEERDKRKIVDDAEYRSICDLYNAKIEALEDCTQALAIAQGERGVCVKQLQERDKRIAGLEIENSCMARQLAEPPERLQRIAELEAIAVGLYMRLPYTRLHEIDEDGDTIVRVRELKGCAAHGKDRAEADSRLDEMMNLWLEDCLEAGDAIPLPEGQENSYCSRCGKLAHSGECSFYQTTDNTMTFGKSYGPCSTGYCSCALKDQRIAELEATLKARKERLEELESSVIATQRIMAEFKHIYPDGFPDGMEARPEHLESQVTSLCNTQRATFQNFVDLIAERDAKSERISDLERQLAEAQKGAKNE